jgi:hypothetical protein
MEWRMDTINDMPGLQQPSVGFPELQRAYAEHRVATYPLKQDKTPAIRGYNTVGAAGSQQLAMKFPTATACGFVAGHRNRLTVVDIDSPDERLVGEVQDRFGVTPFQVLTPSGGWHCYYRHAGEDRRIRPLQDVDILGGGNVVAAGSVVPKGKYRIERGTLDDLDRLPPMRPQDNRPARDVTVTAGRRDDEMFRQLLREVKHCDDFDALLDKARTINMTYDPPMLDAQVISKAVSAWKYEAAGRNWVGHKARASTDREEILALRHDPGAAMLLNLLRVSHQPDDRFAIDQIKTATLLQWSREMLRTRIKALMAAGRLGRVHYGRGKGDPHLYVLKRDRV